jgi:hypothetical protein
MQKAQELLDQLEEKRNFVKQAEAEVESHLQVMAKTLGATFSLDSGKFFQIRCRQGASYLSSLKGDPKEWLMGRPKGSTNKVKAKAAAPAEDAVEMFKHPEPVTTQTTVVL